MDDGLQRPGQLDWRHYQVDKGSPMADTNANVSSEYLTTLLLYYEEEVMGEAYFYGLCEHFPEADQQRKLRLLAEVERHSADAVHPLIDKYHLQPRQAAELSAIGATHVDAHKDWTWNGLITYMTQRYPLYLDDFTALENLAPGEDQLPLKFLTHHEVMAIEFAQRELADDADSTRPLSLYLSQAPNQFSNR